MKRERDETGKKARPARTPQGKGPTCDELRRILRQYNVPNRSKLKNRSDLLLAVQKIRRKQATAKSDHFTWLTADLKTKVLRSLLPRQTRALSVVSKTQFKDADAQIKKVPIINLVNYLDDYFRINQDVLHNYYGMNVEHECHIGMRSRETPADMYDIYITQHTPTKVSGIIVSPSFPITRLLSGYRRPINPVHGISPKRHRDNDPSSSTSWSLSKASLHIITPTMFPMHDRFPHAPGRTCMHKASSSRHDYRTYRTYRTYKSYKSYISHSNRIRIFFKIVILIQSRIRIEPMTVRSASECSTPKLTRQKTCVATMTLYTLHVIPLSQLFSYRG